MTTYLSALTPDSLRAAVAEQYGYVAKLPEAHHPFPVGRAFAESLGYSSADLDSLPASAVAAFAGISQPLLHARLQPGEIVLDLGCGAGMDTILLARQIGPTGIVHALDLSADMLESARANVTAAQLDNVIFHQSPAEMIPLPDGSVDVVLVNGIFNLCPDKEPVMHETFRVLRPEGRLLVSEIVLQDPDGEEELGGTCGLTLQDWFTWERGALPERSFLALLHETGFQDIGILARSQNARTTRAEMVVADIRAVKPAGVASAG